MPPADRFVCRFAAEPPQDPAPYGRWADALREAFLGACLEVAADEEPAGDISWYPDRTWNGRTYVPASVPTRSGGELYGFVSHHPGEEHFEATANFTEETAEANPDWQVDLSDEVVGTWRGENGKQAAMTLVWGRPMVTGTAIATAELADLAVDQCALDTSGRFTLLAPDDYRGDTLDVKMWSSSGELVAAESLYVEDEEDVGSSS